MRILDELRQYVDAVVSMQAKYNEDLPNFRDFNASRRHTAAVGINVGLLEYISLSVYTMSNSNLSPGCRYSYNLEIPNSFFEHEAVQTIIDKTCFLIQKLVLDQSSINIL